MQRKIMIAQFALALSVATAAVLADIEAPGPYDLSWNTIDAGGSAAGAGTYQLTSTIGQPDANDSPMIGGVYTLRGGFWHGVTQTCQSDINADNVVNIDDLLAVINAWGATGGPANLNGDNTVNIDDLLIVINGWGNCPP